MSRPNLSEIVGFETVRFCQAHPFSICWTSSDSKEHWSIPEERYKFWSYSFKNREKKTAEVCNSYPAYLHWLEHIASLPITQPLPKYSPSAHSVLNGPVFDQLDNNNSSNNNNNNNDTKSDYPSNKCSQIPPVFWATKHALNNNQNNTLCNYNTAPVFYDELESEFRGNYTYRVPPNFVEVCQRFLRRYTLKIPPTEPGDILFVGSRFYIIRSQCLHLNVYNFPRVLETTFVFDVNDLDVFQTIQQKQVIAFAEVCKLAASAFSYNDVEVIRGDTRDEDGDAVIMDTQSDAEGDAFRVLLPKLALSLWKENQVWKIDWFVCLFVSFTIHFVFCFLS